MATAILGILVTPIWDIAKCLLEPVGEKLRLVLDCEKNIKELQDQVEALKSTKESVEEGVKEARKRNEIINLWVPDWQKEVQVIESEAQSILVKSVNNYLNLCLRYKLSEEALQKAVKVSKLESEGKFNSISYPNPDVASASMPPPPIDLLIDGDFKAFESTTRAMNRVMSGLKDQQTHVIGVYGMGGIGKTTLMKEVWKRVKVDFEQVIFATVSQNPDLKRIQGEIAEGLGKQLQEEGVLMRALRLTSWLKQKKTVLIILDDVWGRVELGELGIPYGADHSGCKVVLTTRSLDVCNLMDGQMNVEVEVLSVQDSWNLFRKVAGDVVESPEFNSVAKEVVQECGGLPIALVTVGRALRNRQANVWYNALRELKKAEPTTIRGMSEKVFSCIKLSFDYLQSEEAKLCFLYCSLFPEDYDVNIEDLVRYTFGDGLLSNDENLMDWRNKTHVIVDDLISCCLLLKGKEKGCARMHDVVRDVAISISNKEKGFMVKARTGLKEWPKGGRLEQVTRMSLMDNEIEKISDTVECPKLEVLLLQKNESLENIADDFFSGMDSLRILDMSNTCILSLPNSLRRPTKLKTLQFNMPRFIRQLNYMLVKQIAFIGELRQLEILSLQERSFEEIPQEFVHLTKLKLLDLRGSKVGSFPKNILSKLSQLEELYMSRSFSQWEMEDSESKGQASLSEFSSLKKLTALQIDIINSDCLFKYNTLGCWKNLQNFRIAVCPSHSPWKEEDPREMGLEYSGSVDDLKNAAEWMKGLMKKTKTLFLVGVDGDSIDELLSADGLTESLEGLHFVGGSITAVCSCKYLKGLRRLESLILGGCSDLKALFLNSDDHENPETNTLPSLKKLLLGELDGLESVIKGYTPPPLCFTNLQILEVYKCKSVTVLFRPEIAETLQQLSYLSIVKCPLLRSIISYHLDEDNLPPSHRLIQEEKVIAFPKLTYIRLSNLSNFEYFSEPPIEVSFPALKELYVRRCDYASSFTEQYKSVVDIVM